MTEETVTTSIRLTPQELRDLKALAVQLGYDGVSDMIRKELLPKLNKQPVKREVGNPDFGVIWKGRPPKK